MEWKLLLPYFYFIPEYYGVLYYTILMLLHILLLSLFSIISHTFSLYISLAKLAIIPFNTLAKHYRACEWGQRKGRRQEAERKGKREQINKQWKVLELKLKLKCNLRLGAVLLPFCFSDICCCPSLSLWLSQSLSCNTKLQMRVWSNKVERKSNWHFISFDFSVSQSYFSRHLLSISSIKQTYAIFLSHSLSLSLVPFACLNWSKSTRGTSFCFTVIYSPISSRVVTLMQQKQFRCISVCFFCLSPFVSSFYTSVFRVIFLNVSIYTSLALSVEWLQQTDKTKKSKWKKGISMLHSILSVKLNRNIN